METKPKNPSYKYWSKLYKGILKQITRQQNKPTIAKAILYPIILSYSSKHSKYIPLKRKYYNNIFTSCGYAMVGKSKKPNFKFSQVITNTN